MTVEKNLDKALGFYQKGYENDCHECAKRLIRYHAEAIELNGNVVSFQPQQILDIFAKIFSRNGFIQNISIRQNYMPL